MSLVVCVLLGSAFVYGEGPYEAILLEQARTSVRSEARSYVSSLSTALNQRFALLEGVRAFAVASVKSGRHEVVFDASFKHFAHELYQSESGIRNFIIAPGGVNQYVYPLERNRKAVGHDLLTDKRPQVRTDVQRAINSGRIALSGPYELRQGGLGLVARTAVYGASGFWGLATTVVDVPPIIEESGIAHSALEGMVALRDGKGQVFFGNADAFESGAVVEQVALPEGRWEMAVFPDGGWGGRIAVPLTMYRALTLITTVLAGIAAYFIAYRQERLRIGVNIRTQELGHENELRRAAEQGLEESRSALQSILDYMPSMIVAVDEDGIITHWNMQAELMTGMTTSEAVGRPYLEVCPDCAHVSEQLSEVIATGQPVELPRKQVSNNGQIAYRDYTVFPFEKGAVARIDDTTERVGVEGLMIQTEKMMSLGGLAAGMAHEINNPLGGILQSIQNINRRLDPSLPANIEAMERSGVNLDAVKEYFRQRRIQEMLDGIKSSGERAGQIVSNMLAFSRRADGRLVPHRLNMLLDEAVSLASIDFDLKKTYDFKDITIAKSYDPNLPSVPCVREDLRQVILNLLRNAAQALCSSPPKDAEPTIWLTLEGNGDYAVLSVEDNGPGIAEDVRDKVFEPFFTTKDPDAGTGLGLSVSYFIITRNHGGRMMVESTPEERTRFIVQLPLKAG